jgi:hypothetical protein
MAWQRVSGIDNIEELMTVFRKNEEETFSLFNYIQVLAWSPVMHSQRCREARLDLCLARKSPHTSEFPLFAGRRGEQTVNQEIEWTMESHAQMQEEMKVFEQQQKEEDHQRAEIIRLNQEKLEG